MTKSNHSETRDQMVPKKKDIIETKGQHPHLSHNLQYKVIDDFEENATCEYYML
jgi:hypothetical protein